MYARTLTYLFVVMLLFAALLEKPHTIAVGP